MLLTRVSFKFPFLSAEVVNSFKNQEDVFHALRSSCHVPFLGQAKRRLPMPLPTVASERSCFQRLRIIGGLGPYCYDGHSYFDGMFWPQMLVPWKGPNPTKLKGLQRACPRTEHAGATQLYDENKTLRA